MLTQEWKDTGLGAGRNRLCPKALGGLGQVSALSGRTVHICKGRDGAQLCLTVATSGCVMRTKAGTTSASYALPGPAVGLGSERASVNLPDCGQKGAHVVGPGVGGLQALGLLLVVKGGCLPGDQESFLPRPQVSEGRDSGKSLPASLGFAA